MKYPDIIGGRTDLPQMSFEKSYLDRAYFLQAATKYFNDRWGLREFDPSGITLPRYRPGFGWGVLMPPAKAQITAQKIFEKLGERFRVWKYSRNSLDDLLDPTKEARQPGKTGHVVWCQAANEADECHKKKSANKIAQEGINVMGLAERLLLEDFIIYQGWAEHLDVVNATLCAGSRFRDGHVPRVRWYGSCSEVSVNGYDPDRANDRLRSRQVVSADARAAA